MPKTLMQSVVGQLQKESKRLEDELHRVRAALAAFGKVYLRGSKPRPAATRKKRTISPAGRKRIAAAQKARWAKTKTGKKLNASKPKT
jgi:hypothetical protein